MDQTVFNELLQRVGPQIEKNDTFFQKTTEPGLRLAITLRYVATRDGYNSLQNSFCVAHNTSSKTASATCKRVLQECREETLVP